MERFLLQQPSAFPTQNTFQACSAFQACKQTASPARVAGDDQQRGIVIADESCILPDALHQT